jgi:hypothetical protein
VFAAIQTNVTLINVNISDTSVYFDGGALDVQTDAVLNIISTIITNATGALQLLHCFLYVPALCCMCNVLELYRQQRWCPCSITKCP